MQVNTLSLNQAATKIEFNGSAITGNKETEIIEIDSFCSDIVSAEIYKYQVGRITVSLEKYQGLINNRWLDDSVIEAYLNAIKLKNTLIIKTNQVSTILNQPLRPVILESNDIHEYEFLVGAYCLENHWNALIINMSKHEFYLIDPMKEQTPELAYQAWRTYYNHRPDKCIKSWSKPKITHQMQIDNVHCGDFVIHFIEQYVTKRHLREKIDDFEALRRKIDKILAENSSL
jgi:Ulp1 family protease